MGRGRGAVCTESERGGCGGEGGPPPQKIFFCPQIVSLGALLTQFLARRKHGQSLEALGHGFCGTKFMNTVQICKKNFRGQTKGKGGGRSHHRPPLPKYATGLMHTSRQH